MLGLVYLACIAVGWMFAWRGHGTLVGTVGVLGGGAYTSVCGSSPDIFAALVLPMFGALMHELWILNSKVE